jgi:hypothetical protein
MKTKLIYILAAFLTFTASSATTTRQPKAHIQIVYQETGNGDYRLYLFGSERALVCEEKAITVVQQGDAVNPVVIECRH